MEIEFLDWYSKNEDRFAHGQFDEKQIAYSAWLDGKKRNSKAENLPMSNVRISLLDDIIDRIETMKGLNGKLSMGEWSYQTIEMLVRMKSNTP